MESKKRLIIVEDNDLYRAALKELINAQAHLEVVAEASSGAEALRVAKEVPADLVLLDLRLPGGSGYAVLPELSGSVAAKILVLTILESDHTIRAALEAGADGYCFKDVGSQELIHAIETVLAGIRYVSRSGVNYPHERRRELRQACDFIVAWAYFNKSGSVAARMLNCSPAGCNFETTHPVAAGATLLIRLEGAAAGAGEAAPEYLRSNVVADVKWCQPRSRRFAVGAKYHCY
ncbi:MAG: response regulator transcription factor [Desulfobacterales bacterium]|jgi:CheY-like chemotaxis protein|nr:response regulator transcription factor [Desulfobacterales bacterium]